MSAQTLLIEPRWSQTWKLEEPRGSVAAAANADSLKRKPQDLPIWVFVSSEGERVVSALPVSVEVREEGPDEDCGSWAYVFSCPKLHVFSSASSYRDAENAFHDQVVHFFHAYKGVRNEDLDEGAASVKALYDKYFKESPQPV